MNAEVKVYRVTIGGCGCVGDFASKNPYAVDPDNPCRAVGFDVTIEGEVIADIPPESNTPVEITIWNISRMDWCNCFSMNDRDYPNPCPTVWRFGLGRVNTWGQEKWTRVRKPFKVTLSFGCADCWGEYDHPMRGIRHLALRFDVYAGYTLTNVKTIDIIMNFDKAQWSQAGFWGGGHWHPLYKRYCLSKIEYTVKGLDKPDDQYLFANAKVTIKPDKTITTDSVNLSIKVTNAKPNASGTLAVYLCGKEYKRVNIKTNNKGEWSGTVTVILTLQGQNWIKACIIDSKGTMISCSDTIYIDKVSYIQRNLTTIEFYQHNSLTNCLGVNTSDLDNFDKMPNYIKIKTLKTTLTYGFAFFDDRYSHPEESTGVAVVWRYPAPDTTGRIVAAKITCTIKAISDNPTLKTWHDDWLAVYINGKKIFSTTQCCHWNTIKLPLKKGDIAKLEIRWMDICSRGGLVVIPYGVIDFIPIQKKITLTANKTTVKEGEQVSLNINVNYTPNTTVKLCLFVEGRRTKCIDIHTDSNGKWSGSATISFPAGGFTAHIKACIVNQSYQTLLCSNEVDINVIKVGHPKITIEANVDKNNVYEGDLITVNAVIKNIGNASSPSAVVYTKVDDSIIVTSKVPTPALPPNGVYKYSFKLKLPSGSHRIKVCFEGVDIMVCSNEIQVEVIKPVVKADIVSFDVQPRKVYTNNMVKVTATIKNTGNVKGTFYIYTLVDGRMVDRQPTMISLNPNETYTYTKNVVMTSEGTHSIKVCVDAR